IFGPCLPTIFDILVPCSKLIFAVVLPVAPAPAECASSTSTSLPARASSTAVIKPVSPAPTTATSAGRSTSTSGFGSDTRSIRSESHSDVMAMAVPRLNRTKPASPMVAPEYADLRCGDGCPSCTGRPEADCRIECRCCTACQCFDTYHQNAECCVPAM